MTSFDINNYTENLTKKENIFFSKDIEEISYPADGHETLFNLEDNSFWFKHRNNCITSLVKEYVADKPFFDVGGGNGFVSKHLQDNGIQTCLVEPGIQGCLNAKKRGITNIICSDLKNAEFKAGTLPYVGLFDVIEHIKDDTGFLSYVSSIIEGGGTVFITVPAYKLLWSKEDADAGHFRRYTLRTLINKLNEAGFETVYSTYIFSFLVLPIFFFRSLPSMLGIIKIGKEKNKKEHATGEKGIANKILAKFLSFEIKQIEKGRSIPFGGSCLIVAKRRTI